MGSACACIKVEPNQDESVTPKLRSHATLREFLNQNVKLTVQLLSQWELRLAQESERRASRGS